MIRRLIAPALIALLMLAPACSKQKEEEPKGNPSAQPAPAFQLSALADDRPIHLSDYKGKVLVLNFWDTWCPPCKAEIPAFNELYAQYKDRGLEFLGVALGREGVDRVKAYMEEAGKNRSVPDYPVAMATEPMVRAYHAAHPLGSIPTTFFIDREGRIQQVRVGSDRKEAFEALILKLL